MLRIAAAILLFLGASGNAFAAQPVPFTAAAFAAAQGEGKPILIDVTAPWCPVCAKQHPILSQLEQTPELRDLVVFDIDFDSQKDVLKQFRVQTQSTRIVFSGLHDEKRDNE